MTVNHHTTVEAIAPRTMSLNNGIPMPQIGFGVFQLDAGETRAAVGTALEAGYRLVDTAAAYGNESAVGSAVKDSDVPREDVFVTSKVWNADQGYDSTLAAFDDSLSKLGFDYLDMYLIHWPVPALDRYLDTWRALEHLYSQGVVRAIGVSNFHRTHLERLLASAQVQPAVNQIECHPLLQQAANRELAARHGIVMQAWSPLARGTALEDERLVEIAARYGHSPADVVLQWHLQLGNAIIPRSVTPSRIRSNLAVGDVPLTAQDMAVIGGMDAGVRVGSDPDEMNKV